MIIICSVQAKVVISGRRFLSTYQRWNMFAYWVASTKYHSPS